MLSIDAEAPLEDTPLLVGTVLFLQAVNIAMLAVSLHDLRARCSSTLRSTGWRTIARTAAALTGVEPVDDDLPHRCHAPREGYVEDVDIKSFCRAFSDSRRVVVHVAPGQHVLKGERLIGSEAELEGHDINRLIPIGAYRSDNQGVVFRIRLIVEIAARALSPAINDFYTALACADKLAAIIESQTSTFVSDDHVPALEGEKWLILIGQDFRGLFAILSTPSGRPPPVSVTASG